MRSFIIGCTLGLVGGVLLAAAVGTPNGPPPETQAARQTVEGADPPIRWRLVSAFPTNMSPQGTRVTELASKIKVISRGDIEMSVNEPGALVQSADIYDAVASGVVDAGFASPSLWAKKSPALQLFGAIPFGPEPAEFLAWFKFGGGNELFDAINHSQNIHSVLCGVVPAAGGGWFKKPVDDISDLADKTIAVSGLGAEVLKNIGATVVVMPPADLANALGRNDVDGAVFSVPTADLGLGFDKRARYYYFPGWHQQTGILELLINLEAWNLLSDGRRAQIESVCLANLGDSLARSEADQFAALKSLVLQGVEVKRWKPEITTALSRAWQAVATVQAAKDKSFNEVWQSLSAFREDYAIWKELGYL